jgi:DNA-binding CsgD family transcriptional regulator
VAVEVVLPLLEREAELAELERRLGAVPAGGGALVLVSGEAGVGKSALVRAFAAAVGERARFLGGACEALFTPRALGPLHDLAPQLGGELARALSAGAARAELFGAVLAELVRPERPSVLVIEDVHWADEATLDLLRFIGRRIQATRALCVLTHRDDELGARHPLRGLLGDLARGGARRIALAPLSSAAVATLARGSGREPEELQRVTGGNPFFVTEVLAAGGARVPASVRDAVLARALPLSDGAREVLELAALVPGSVERRLVSAILGERRREIEECVAAGLLRSERRGLAFRHELARLALEAELDPARRAELHARLLGELEGQESELARAVYHAEQVGDGARLLALAPRAAERAAALGAHREAAAHLASALRHAAALPDEARARLLERRAYECYLTDQIPEALEARLAALDLWRALGDRAAEGDGLRWASRLSWFLGKKAAADAHGRAAVATLEPLGPSHALAMAYSNLAQLAMLADDGPEAIAWGTRAIELAERLADVEVLAHALNNVGTARWTSDWERGRAELERSLALAQASGLEEHVARAWTNLGSSAVRLRDYATASQALSAGIAYASERDLDSWTLYMRAWRARLALEQGRWDAAADEVEALLARADLAPITRIPCLCVLGRLRARRGDPGADERLAEARALALETAEPQRIVPVALARAEAAWFAGEDERCRSEARAGLASLGARAEPWDRGELALWLVRAGEPAPSRAGLAEPFALALAGDAEGAARAWERLGCPFERALALASSPEEGLALRGLLALRELGAGAAARRVERELRARGLRGIPRGARPTTRGNPAGLTPRELEILGLLGRGLANKDIARSLHLAPKTVDHHVSAVLGKLGVSSRARAAARARELGWL